MVMSVPLESCHWIYQNKLLKSTVQEYLEYSLFVNNHAIYPVEDIKFVNYKVSAEKYSVTMVTVRNKSFVNLIIWGIINYATMGATEYTVGRSKIGKV